MRVLIVGSGGREHALAWALSREGGHDIHAAPGNPGLARSFECHPVSVSDLEGLAGLAAGLDADLVVPGPEAPLVAGLADILTGMGRPVFGPPAAGAMIEGSKWFAKEIMLRAGVPTAEGRVCSSAAEVIEAAGGDWTGWVLKADGLAGGKGVFLPSCREEAEEALRSLFPGGRGRVVAERRLAGPEVSVMALCSSGRAHALPPGRDHKRAFDGDAGPNTGGMGAVCPPPGLDGGFAGRIAGSVIEPVLREMENRGIRYRGALYAGLILTPDGPRVLEFNCRFGDPETQAVMPLVKGDLAAAMLSCALGEPRFDGLETLPGASACVVMASRGYPGPVSRGVPVEIPELSGGTIVFHAGTALRDGRLVTDGGRVLGVTGLGRTLAEAVESAYEAVGSISFDGAFWRSDIGRAR